MSDMRTEAPRCSRHSPTASNRRHPRGRSRPVLVRDVAPRPQCPVPSGAFLPLPPPPPVTHRSEAEGQGGGGRCAGGQHRPVLWAAQRRCCRGRPGGGRSIGTVPGQQRDRGYDSAPSGGLPRGVCGAGSLGGTVQDVPWVLPFRIEAPPPGHREGGCAKSHWAGACACGAFSGASQKHCRWLRRRERGGGGVRGRKTVCVPKIGLRFPAPVINSILCRRKLFLMWVGRGRAGPQTPPLPPLPRGVFEQWPPQKWH